MSGCAGLTYPSEFVLERTVIDHLLAKGVATLIVDPFTPRNEPEGVCAKLNKDTFGQYATRGGNDAVAALKDVKAMPDIDPNRVFCRAIRLERYRRSLPWTRRPRGRTTPKLPGSSRTIPIAMPTSNLRPRRWFLSARRTTGRPRRFARPSKTSRTLRSPCFRTDPVPRRGVARRWPPFPGWAGLVKLPRRAG